MTTRVSLFAAAGLLLTAAGCASSEKPEGADLATTADLHRILVTEAPERLELVVNPDDAALAPEYEASVRRFARLYNQQGHGALVLSVPNSSDNAESAGRIGDQVRLSLADAGVSFASISRASYDAAGRGAPPIILSFLTYEAEAPKCDPLYTQDLAHATNSPWKSFGCSQQANLAAMLANPGDLLGPRDEDPRDAARRAVVLEAYRNGKQTHAERSGDERVQVSKAVK